MRFSKLLVAIGAATVLAVSMVAVSAALITSQTGSVIKLGTPPASVALNALEDATKVHTFDERLGVTLTTGVAVDAANPGTYSSFPNGTAKVGAGRVVDSHLIHSDIPASGYTSARTGTVTFGNNILGVVASTSRLAASDFLGAPGTTYAGTTANRGLETGENGEPANFSDNFTISANRRTLTFAFGTFKMDEIRVITAHTNQLVTTVTDSPDPVQAGDFVTYTITVTNTGATTATGVQVQDSFPGATLASATASGGCTGTTTVTCSLGSIPAADSAVATVIVTSPSTVPPSGTITNTATAPPGVSPAGSATTTVVPPVLTTDITDAPDPVTAGNDVQYTVTVTNDGIAPVFDPHVIDTLPPDTTLVSASSPLGCTGTGPVDCALDALGVGESATAKLVVTSPAVVPEGGTMTNSAVATPGTQVAGTQTTTVEVPVDGVSKGFVVPGGDITIPGDDPATLTLPPTGDGAPVIITQGDGTFCDGPCGGTATTISDFPGYSDPNNPIHITLTYLFPSSATSLTDAATAFGATIYKNTDPENPGVGSPVPFSAAMGAGVADPAPCVDTRSIAQPSFNSFVVTFEIVYLSGDPKFARR